MMIIHESLAGFRQKKQLEDVTLGNCEERFFTISLINRLTLKIIVGLIYNENNYQWQPVCTVSFMAACFPFNNINNGCRWFVYCQRWKGNGRVFPSDL